MVMAKGIHLFPFRTQQLSPYTSTILGWQRPGKIDRRRILKRSGHRFCSVAALWFWNYAIGPSSAMAQ